MKSGWLKGSCPMIPATVQKCQWGTDMTMIETEALPKGSVVPGSFPVKDSSYGGMMAEPWKE